MINTLKRSNQWRSLHLLNLYRLLISGTFLSFLYTQTTLPPFGSINPSLFQYTSALYFIFSIISGINLRWQWPRFYIQSHIQLSGDLLFLTILMYFSGGIDSGVGILMLIPIASSSLLFSQLSPIYAAIGFFLIFSEQVYLHWTIHINPSFYQTGMLGAIFFLATFLSYYLVKQAEENEALAQQREIELADMEQLAQFIIQRMQTGVIVVNSNGMIRLINHTAKQFCPHITVLKQYTLENISPPLHTIYTQWLHNEDIHQATLHAHDNTILQPSFARLSNNNDSDILIFLENITHLTQQAQQLKLASLGRLTASIAHEIRNPLSSISHASSLLAETPNLAPTEQRLTNIIKKNVQRIDNIITTILNLGRNNVISHQKTLHLESWLITFFDDYFKIYPEKKDMITINLGLTQHYIHFDENQLQQILNNLLENAILHNTSQEKTITLSTYITPQQQIILEIKNPGNISEIDEKQLFEPFFTTKSTGTGLGLYISRELALNNHAHLQCVRNISEVCFQLHFNTLNQPAEI